MSLYRSLLLLAFIAITSIPGAHAQLCNTTFEKLLQTNGNLCGNAVIFSSQQEIIIAGIIDQRAGNKQDAFLMKADGSCNTLWAKSIALAENDQFTKVRETKDKGFIALGSSEESGIRHLLIVKTDVSGLLQWSRTINIEDKPLTGKDIVELSNGGYALVATAYDSTAQSDGILARLDGTGNLLWSQIFDGGRADGFNCVLELNGELLVTGYTTGDLKDAIFMKASLSDGHSLLVQKYTKLKNYDEEGISLVAIPGGYTWVVRVGQTYDYYTNRYFNFYILKMKATADGNIYSTQNQLLNSTGGSGATILQVMPDAHNGYVYCYNGPASTGQQPQMGRTLPDGRQEWLRFSGYGSSTFTGLDITSDYGYVFIGNQPYYPGNAIRISKTDLFGFVGTCSQNTRGDQEETNEPITGVVFQWTSSRQPSATIISVSPLVTDIQTTAITNCSNQYCTTLPVDNGNSCATSFHADVKQDGYSTELFDVTRTSDGDIVTVGTKMIARLNQPEIMKLKPGGNVRWTKQFNNQTRIGEDVFTVYRRIISTRDNNLLVVGQEDITFNNGGTDSGVVMKMDYNGKVLWAKRMARLYHSSFDFVQETEDGSFIIVNNVGSAAPPMANDIIRMDKNGNIVWQKTVDGWLYDNRFIRAMLYDNGSIYLATDCHNFTSNRNEIIVVKLDATNGDLRWAKHFSAGNETVSLLGITKIKDVLYVGLGLLTQIDWNKNNFNAAVLKLKDATGDEMQGFRLNNPGLVIRRKPWELQGFNPVTFTKSLDDQLVIAHESLVGTDSTIRIHKLDVNGAITWSRNYSQLKLHTVNALRADGSGFLVVGYQYGSNLIGEEDCQGLLMRLNSNGEIESSTGECVSEPVPSSPSSAYTSPLFLQNINDIQYNTVASVLSINAQHPMPLDNPFVFSYPTCASFDACEAPVLKGPASICDLSKTWMYQASKSAGCNTPLLWQTDAAYVDIISQSETKLEVKFKTLGTTDIKTVVDAGCGLLPATVTVEIPRPAASIDLGKDTELCKNASLQLSAGEGFESYTWSNGSSGQQLKIDAPGTYAITVTDKCKTDATDQIVVADGNRFPFSVGPDVVKCSETLVTRALPDGFSNYTWNTNYNRTDKLGAVDFFPKLDTAYVVQADRPNGCQFKDTVVFSIQQPVKPQLPPDDAICTGDSIKLTVDNGFSDIAWKDGSSKNAFMAKQAGEYIVNAKDINGCAVADTFNLSLKPLPTVSLSKEPYLCEGDNRVLDAGNSGVFYLWNTGSTNRSISVNDTGKWWVKVTGSNGCNMSDTAWIKQLNKGPQDFIVPDTVMCIRGDIAIPVKGKFNNYHWSNGSGSPQLITRTPGMYWIEVTDAQGCIGKDTVNISTKDCGWGVYVPNAFTPNNDGANDVLRPVVLGRTVKFRFAVYDRWGKMVFQTNTIDEGWDGTVNNLNAPSGTFAWICVYQMDGDVEVVLKGVAVLVR